MSDYQQYYIGLDDLAGYGDLYFLKFLQDAASSGGGENLLGSVVQRVKTGIFGWGHGFPVPMLMTTAQSFLKAIPGDSNVKEIVFAASKQVAAIDSSGSAGLNVGPFPSVPVTLGVDLDWNKAVQVNLTVGGGSLLHYIPRGYSAQLYRSVAGDDKHVDVTGIVGSNFVVETVLLSKTFSVEFVSSESFDADFQAKLDAINAIPNVGGKLKLNDATKKSVTAEIDGTHSYLVALGVARWSDFDLD
jgi:hypothetical protein